jgi:tetratricopeptide (TPR) repeat protein
VRARYETGQALAAYATIGPAQLTFQQLAMLARRDGNDALLGELIEAHARTDPKDRDVARYRALRKVIGGELEAARALLRDGLAAQPDRDQRMNLLDQFLFDLIDSGKVLDGYRAAPDPVVVFQVLASDLREEGRLEELRQLLDLHRREHADDLWIGVYAALLDLHDQHWDQAAQGLGAAWQKAPAEVRDRIRPDYALALYRASTALEAYHKVEPGSQVFAQLSGLLIADKRGPELLALVETERRSVGDSPHLRFLDGRAHFLLKREPDLAITLIKEAYRQQPDRHQRRQYVQVLVQEMFAAGMALQGYRTAPDKRIAFEALGRELVKARQLRPLDELLAEHALVHGNDPWLEFFRGERALQAGDLAQAEHRFRLALGSALPAQRWEFQIALWRAQVRCGHIDTAYQAAGGGARTFEALAGICQQERNAPELLTLIDAHGAAEPDDPSLPFWNIEVSWLSEDYGIVVELIAPRRAELANNPRFASKVDSQYVRSLVKLKRRDRAVREAAALVKANRPGSRLLLLYAHAAAGDVPGMLAAIAQAPRQSWLLRDTYADPDLGPLVRGDALRAFRERYPERK